MELLNHAVIVLSGLFTGLMLYQGGLFLASFLKTRKKSTAGSYRRFALVASARNEENVIGHLIDSLKAQNYPKEAFDIFIIADNCTDATGERAADKGALVYYRHDMDNIGKGYALGWFFKQFMPSLGQNYDAIGIFDADNLVDKDFLRSMNDKLSAGASAVMGYRDSKNPYDSWVSGCMSMGFWGVADMYYQPHDRFGLTCIAGGTGYVFKTELIKDGWNTQTICEDAEFTIQLAARGHAIAYEPNARFYDEQPVDFKTSARQRLRWAVGGYQNMKVGLPLLFRSLKTQSPALILDSVIYMLMLPAFALNMLFPLFNLAFQLLLPPAMRGADLVQLMLLPLTGLLGLFFQGAFILLLARRFSPRLLKSLFMYPFFMFTTGIINIAAVFTPKLSWRPIEHKRSIGIGQME